MGNVNYMWEPIHITKITDKDNDRQRINFRRLFVFKKRDNKKRHRAHIMDWRKGEIWFDFFEPQTPVRYVIDFYEKNRREIDVPIKDLLKKIKENENFQLVDYNISSLKPKLREFPDLNG